MCVHDLMTQGSPSLRRSLQRAERALAPPARNHNHQWPMEARRRSTRKRMSCPNMRRIGFVSRVASSCLNIIRTCLARPGAEPGRKIMRKGDRETGDSGCSPCIFGCVFWHFPCSLKEKRTTKNVVFSADCPSKIKEILDFCLTLYCGNCAYWFDQNRNQE